MPKGSNYPADRGLHTLYGQFLLPEGSLEAKRQKCCGGGIQATGLIKAGGCSGLCL